MAFDKDKYVAIEAHDGEWFLILRVEYEADPSPLPDRRYAYYTITDNAIVIGNGAGVTTSRLGLRNDE